MLKCSNAQMLNGQFCFAVRRRAKVGLQRFFTRQCSITCALLSGIVPLIADWTLLVEAYGAKELLIFAGRARHQVVEPLS